MISDIPAEKYKDLYLYGVGMADVEFSMDIYASPKDLDGVTISTKDYTIEPAIEIVLYETPHNIERKAEDVLLFKDFKQYLQKGRNFAVVNREDWSYKLYEYRIPAISFYQREGFEIQYSGLDEATGEKDYVMVWQQKYK